MIRLFAFFLLLPSLSAFANVPSETFKKIDYVCFGTAEKVSAKNERVDIAVSVITNALTSSRTIVVLDKKNQEVSKYEIPLSLEEEENLYARIYTEDISFEAIGSFCTNVCSASIRTPDYKYGRIACSR